MIHGQDIDTFKESCFPLSNKLARLVWQTTYLLLFRFSPRPLHAWRRFLLKLFGAQIGRGCHIYSSVRIWAPWQLECGEETGIGDHVVLYNQARIKIGRRCVISQGSHLCTGSHDYRSSNFRLFALPITVADGVWIAAECFLHPGVKIGEEAVIGARAVVTKSMPAHMICSGHPCEPIKPRNIQGTPGTQLRWESQSSF